MKVYGRMETSAKSAAKLAEWSCLEGQLLSADFIGRKSLVDNIHKAFQWFRSDATLNRGGVRIGTAEIYSVVETFPEIDDCIVAGQLVWVVCSSEVVEILCFQFALFSPDFDDEHILLFVKMADLFTLTDDLKRRICLQIRTMMSPRHVPNAIYAVKDIPVSYEIELVNHLPLYYLYHSFCSSQSRSKAARCSILTHVAQQKWWRRPATVWISVLVFFGHSLESCQLHTSSSVAVITEIYYWAHPILEEASLFRERWRSLEPSLRVISLLPAFEGIGSYWDVNLWLVGDRRVGHRSSVLSPSWVHLFFVHCGPRKFSVDFLPFWVEHHLYLSKF